MRMNHLGVTNKVKLCRERSVAAIIGRSLDYGKLFATLFLGMRDKFAKISVAKVNVARINVALILG